MKIGIIGAGQIAQVMARTVSQMPDLTLYAVCSAHVQSAQKLAAEFGFHKVYESSQQLLTDPQVELVYVATPHSTHYELMKQCIAYRKPVLCEKPFATNYQQAAEIMELARQNGVFVCEAFWSRFLPIHAQVAQELAGGAIGEVRMVMANIGGVGDHQPRIRERRFAGGALLDVGIYAITFASMWLGPDVKQVRGQCTKLDTGVDSQAGIWMEWADNRVAVLSCTTHAAVQKSGMVCGSEGYVCFDHINNPKTVSFFDQDRQLVRTLQAPPQITGYEYEMAAVVTAVQQGKLECEQIPHAETLRILSIADQLRKQWGVVYDWEKPL